MWPTADGYPLAELFHHLKPDRGCTLGEGSDMLVGRLILPLCVVAAGSKVFLSSGCFSSKRCFQVFMLANFCLTPVSSANKSFFAFSICMVRATSAASKAFDVYSLALSRRSTLSSNNSILSNLLCLSPKPNPCRLGTTAVGFILCESYACV